ncbi:DUF7266 family protein [Natronolimnobius baerhuensis]|uniref:Uncharacterized protein n=1 Tax=Natronolimnobius baerhuensis TaxID=253108 RepID=A0A202EC96_9EURY|nr:hypothetical protein [Natronolimnobius baerhuensis]OVE85630.1 hypothetical protein B2G88_02045 [Natronolimnobius baerhuensis]
MIGPQTKSHNRMQDRGVSVAITHVLTIGITTILIAMLLMSGSTLLESETDRSADTSLETVGERIAGEIGNVDQIASTEGTNDVTLTVDHPRTVSNSGYSVTLLEDCNEDGDHDAPLIGDDLPCLELETYDHDAVVHVPVAVETDVDDRSTATGGSVEISYDGSSITLEGAN